MRSSAIATAIFIATLASTSTAQAQVAGVGQDLHFVAETNVVGPGNQNMALCHLVENWVMLFIPIVTFSESYAYAQNRCDTDSYIPLDDRRVAYEKSIGNLPMDLSDSPQLSTGIIIKNAIVGLIAAIFALIFIRRKYQEIIRG